MEPLHYLLLINFYIVLYLNIHLLFSVTFLKQNHILWISITVEHRVRTVQMQDSKLGVQKQFHLIVAQYQQKQPLLDPLTRNCQNVEALSLGFPLLVKRREEERLLWEDGVGHDVRRRVMKAVITSVRGFQPGRKS